MEQGKSNYYDECRDGQKAPTGPADPVEIALQARKDANGNEEVYNELFTRRFNAAKLGEKQRADEVLARTFSKDRNRKIT